MFLLWTIKDTLEILFFTIILYYFSLWLKKDKRTNLLIYFYGICIIFSLSTFFQLYTISSFFMGVSPIILLLFIIFHQDILQKNFITMHNKPLLIQQESADWLENLIRSSLHAINNNKQLLCVIEHTSDLKPFLNPAFIFNSPLQTNIVTLLIDSSSFDQQKMIWCNTNGKLIAINTTWSFSPSGNNIDNTIPVWQQEALLMTLKTDTILFKANPDTRLFDLIIKGTLYEELSCHNTLALIKKHVTPVFNKGDISYDSNHQKQSFK